MRHAIKTAEKVQKMWIYTLKLFTNPTTFTFYRNLNQNTSTKAPEKLSNWKFQVREEMWAFSRIV